MYMNKSNVACFLFLTSKQTNKQQKSITSFKLSGNCFRFEISKERRSRNANCSIAFLHACVYERKGRTKP